MKCKTKKKCYETLEQATEEAVFLSCKKKMINQPELFPYRCKKCGFFHLTSRGFNMENPKIRTKVKRKLMKQSLFIFSEARDYYMKNRKEYRKLIS